MQETLQADRQGKQDCAAQPGQGSQPGKMDGRESPCFHHRETRSWLLGSSPLTAASFSARCSSGGLIAALVSATTPPRFPIGSRSEEHTSELQSLMRISYAVFCLHNKHQTYSL